ncbi:MAG: maleylpyruvate isomerase N-terminal domain-containing protein [Mycobacterium sp.]
MRSLEEIRAALERCYGATEALCADLTDTEWKFQSLCPDWSVRGVVSHVTSIEAVLAGWLPDDAATPPPFGRAAEFERETAVLDNAAFADRVRTIYDHRRRDLAALTQADLERPSWTPTGPGSYGRFLEIRVFDFWVHERDITTPLTIAADDTGVAAEIALGEVEASLGYIVGKKVGLPEGKSIAFRLTGPIVRDLNVLVDGRAKQVGHLDRRDVEIITDSTTFVQLACGRIDPQAVIDSGGIEWNGDAELGERAARNLRFTM